MGKKRCVMEILDNGKPMLVYSGKTKEMREGNKRRLLMYEFLIGKYKQNNNNNFVKNDIINYM